MGLRMERGEGSRREGGRPLLGGEAGSFPWGRNAEDLQEERASETAEDEEKNGIGWGRGRGRGRGGRGEGEGGEGSRRGR